MCRLHKYSSCNYSCNSSGICLYHLCTSGYWYFCSFFLEKLLWLWQIGWRPLVKSNFQVFPQILNQTEVRVLVLNHFVSILSSRIILYLFSQSTLPSTLTSFIVLTDEKHPHMMLPPSCFSEVLRWQAFLGFQT